MESLYNYRIKKIYHYDNLGKESVSYHPQRKMPIIGWVYFYDVKSYLPKGREWFGLLLFLGSIFGPAAFIMSFASSGTPTLTFSLPLFLFALSANIIFFSFIYIRAWKQPVRYDYDYKEETPRNLIKARYEYRSTQKKKKGEIIELSITIERRRKLENLK